MSQIGNYAPQNKGVTQNYPYQSNSTKSSKVPTSQDRKNLSIAQIFQQKGLKYNGPSKLQLQQQTNAQKMKNMMDQNGVILHPKSQLKGGALTTSNNTAQNSPRVFNKNKNSMYQKNQNVVSSVSRKPSTASMNRQQKSQTEFENMVQQTEVLYGNDNDAFRQMKELEPSKLSGRLASNQSEFVSQKSYKNYVNQNSQAHLLDGGTGSNPNSVNKQRKGSVAYTQSGNQISVQLPGALQTNNFYSINQNIAKNSSQPQMQKVNPIPTKFVKIQPN